MPSSQVPSGPIGPSPFRQGAPPHFDAALPGAGANHAAPDLAASDLAALLASGEAALFPTDTLPALAAQPASAWRLWEIKARPADKPLILMGADLDQLVEALDLPWRQEWLEQARRCWPGAVTLVLPITGRLTEALHPGGTSLGLRVPANEAARSLLRISGPLATTSANRSGQTPATSAAEAALRFPDLPRLGPVPWRAGSGQASTVLAWQAAGSWRVLRAGAAKPALPGVE
jgi:L-threonylcarbamoyladenylate synthase